MQIKGQLLQTMKELNEWPRFRLRLFLEGILVGILAGLVISLFRWALEYATQYRHLLYESLLHSSWTGHLAWFVLLLAAAYLLYRLSRYEPMAVGSGITQVKGVILGVMRMHWFRILWVKLVGCIMAIGMGLSLGRQGPSIQLGAVVGQGMSRILGRTRMEERYLITAGAGAGLAAAFNAPLAGVVFALEELHRNFSSAVLATSMAAAMVATVVSRVIFGQQAVIHLGMVPIFPLQYLWLVVVVAVLVGICGVGFNFGLLHIHRFYDLPVFPHPYVRIAFALVLAGILGYSLPQVLGGGEELINSLSGVPISLFMVLVILAGKFIFTLLSYGCGVPGGFFLPMLVIGALLGATLGIVFIDMGLMDTDYLLNIVIIAMAAFFSSSVHSPITATVLIMEMTGSYEHLLVLGTASLIALVVSDICHGQPIYDVLLRNSLQQKRPVIPQQERRNIIELTICSASFAEGKRVRDIPWPEHALLVDIKRGAVQMIPAPDMRLRAGDFIYVLSDNVEAAAKVRQLVEEAS